MPTDAVWDSASRLAGTDLLIHCVDVAFDWTAGYVLAVGGSILEFDAGLGVPSFTGGSRSMIRDTICRTWVTSRVDALGLGSLWASVVT